MQESTKKLEKRLIKLESITDPHEKIIVQESIDVIKTIIALRNSDISLGNNSESSENTDDTLSHEEYMDLFYEDEFDANMFINYFVYVLIENNVYTFDRKELQSFIRDKKAVYNDILHDFKFKSNGISYYSSNFADVIFGGKLKGYFYTESPEMDDVIYIHSDLNFSEDWFDEAYLKSVKIFVNEFLKVNYRIKK